MSEPLIPEQIRLRMDAMHGAREEALSLCRQIIQTASKSIRATHRREFAEAQVLLDTAVEKCIEARKRTANEPKIEFAGYIQDAEKEVIEAEELLAAVQNQRPSINPAFRPEASSFLHGIAEAASEARRYVLDSMRTGKFDEAMRLMRWMEDIYDELIAFDYPDGLTGGLRRTTDALRAVVERTRSDLTLTVMQRELYDELRLVRQTNE